MLYKHAYFLGAITALKKLGATLSPIEYAPKDSIASESSVRSQDELDELWRTFDRDNQLSALSKVATSASTFGVGQALKVPGAVPKNTLGMGALPKIPKTPKPQTPPGTPKAGIPSPNIATPQTTMPGTPMTGLGPQQNVANIANNLSAATSMQSVPKRLMGNVV